MLFHRVHRVHRVPASAPQLRRRTPSLLATALLSTLTVLGGLGVTAGPAAAAPSLGQRAVAEAASHQGKPYRYGAAGPTRFDCSGLTQYVFGRLGRHLPRHTSAQYAATSRVAQADRAPGDLLFMWSSDGSISHVGIYAGGNRWWVAPKTGDVVKLQTLYSNRYVVGRVG